MINDAESGASTTAAGPAREQPDAPPQRLNAVVRRVKLELVTDRSTRKDRSSGFDPYDRGGTRDVWGRRRHA